MKRLIVAIDGPSGSGKSTLGKRLARRLGFTSTSIPAPCTGRSPGGPCGAGIDLDDADAVTRLAGDLRIELESRPDGVGVAWTAGT